MFYSAARLIKFKKSKRNGETIFPYAECVVNLGLNSGLFSITIFEVGNIYNGIQTQR